MKRLLFFISILLLVTSCTDVDNHITDGTGVKQEFMDEYLVTIAKYKTKTIWQSFDRIRLNTNDSIKIVRYYEAEQWVTKFKQVDIIVNAPN